MIVRKWLNFSTWYLQVRPEVQVAAKRNAWSTHPTPVVGLIRPMCTPANWRRTAARSMESLPAVLANPPLKLCKYSGWCKVVRRKPNIIIHTFFLLNVWLFHFAMSNSLVSCHPWKTHLVQFSRVLSGTWLLPWFSKTSRLLTVQKVNYLMLLVFKPRKDRTEVFGTPIQY